MTWVLSDAAKDEDPIYRLGMLYFFETKNIGKKPKRRDKFLEYGDALSQHDMDFDWADETLHANYGNHWLRTYPKSGCESNQFLDQQGFVTELFG
ncbi:hypothetical protein KFU94_41160 [Chloroflexi bacterium TSY]|nr:hypothetical protein [Chloroflexi bacterium TSY]